MAQASAKVALDDELLLEYFFFKNNKIRNQNLTEKLLTNIKMPFVVDTSQGARCIKSIQEQEPLIAAEILSTELQSAWLALGGPDKTDIELADESVYKLMLTGDVNKVAMPYFNLNQNSLSSFYTRTAGVNESRQDIQLHLKQLCSEATKITICDNYFAARWNSTRQLFLAILPRHQLDIEYIETPSHLNATRNSTAMTQNFVQSICNQWSISSSNYYQNAHDRYLLIESPKAKIEVMLSSGFLYLWNLQKEITCVIREL